MAAVPASALSRWAPVAAYMAAIFAVSSVPNLAVPSGTTDWSWHTVEYAGLAVLIGRALAGGFGRPLTWGLVLSAIAIAVGYALSDELHQMFVPGRFSDWHDVAADAAGAAIGAFAAWAWGIKYSWRDEL